MYQPCRHHLQPVHRSGWHTWGLLLPVHRLPFHQSVLCCKCYTLIVYLLSTLYTGYNCLNCRVLDFLFPCQFHFTLSSQTTVTVIFLLIIDTLTMNMSFLYYLSQFCVLTLLTSAYLTLCPPRTMWALAAQALSVPL